MKKIFSVLLIGFFALSFSQETANRFFYQLTFKPKKDSTKIDKVMTILDITKEKSIYRDFTVISQDSIMKIKIEEMQKAGVYKDISKSFAQPKFSEKIYKFYPGMKIQYIEKIANGMTPSNIGYNEDLKLDWKIENEKQKIGNYNTQKATVNYGGRQWIAWFSTEVPFQDGPYKFYGLPGLIIKIEDKDKNYSWELKGNKKISDFKEASYIEEVMRATGGKVVEVSKEKFERTFSDFKKDPFASARPMFTSEMLSQKIPGMDGTIGDMIKKQEKAYKDFYNYIDNSIEIPTTVKTAR